eukprot:CAMPEP_0168345618 /NCGR_PEP_ID=MMETSP0213-20121227/17686_1 /TAXON_ID=151035 /ORGANISM="Euplotes harpa, Strain FSP1.4" /LENGTH=84 /DNA_ID=CAMNT_0008353919 /DNA_START=1 /DNA_END=251 /DNA_ORIENTATION=+
MEQTLEKDPKSKLPLKLVINTKKVTLSKETFELVCKANSWKETSVEGEEDIIWSCRNNYENYREFITTKETLAFSKFPQSSMVT